MWRVLVLALTLGAMAPACLAADELCLTGNARNGQNLAVGLTTEPAELGALFDGSHADARSVGLPADCDLHLRFAEAVRVTRVVVVCYNDDQRSYNGAERCQVTVRRGDEVVEQSQWASLEGGSLLRAGTDDVIVWGSETEVALGMRGPADELVLRVEKHPGAFQGLIREVQVWGMPERLAVAALRPGTSLAAQVAGNTYSSLRVSWDDDLPEGGYARVRLRAADSDAWESRCFTRSPGVVMFLRPATEYEVTTEVVGGPQTGERAAGPRRVRLPGPLEVRTMADSFGMNFYPGGGGAHQARDDETAMTRRMIRMMAQAGVRHVRWWAYSPGGARMFTEAGLAPFPSANFAAADQYAQLVADTGAWLVATANEPDFGNVTAAEYVDRHRAGHAAARAFDPLLLVAGPAVGGEMVGPGADYLRGCYEAGLTHAVDVLDVHPYSKMSTPTARGGIPGGPEGLLASMAGCREVMVQEGDAMRPLIASESGHPTTRMEWFMPCVSLERQAQWIVRTHLLLLASGVQRIYWYAFQDEGTDPLNPEHHFGIVDWEGRPKPAYETYQAMAGLLGSTVCEGLEPGLEAPVYGVRCRANEGYITALWDSGGRSEVLLRLSAGLRRLVSLEGETRPVRARQGAVIPLVVDENVVYVVSDHPLKYAAQERLEPPVQPQVRYALEPTTVQVTPGQRCTWTARLESEYDCEVRVTLDTASPFGGPRPEAQVTLPAHGTAEVEMGLEVPAEVKPAIISWDVRCQVEAADGQWPPQTERRAIYFVTR